MVIEDSGWRAGRTGLICKKVGGNQLPGCFIEETAVADGVTGERDDLESADFVSLLEPVIDVRRGILKKESSDGFQKSADPAPSLVSMFSVNVCPVVERSMDLATSELLDPRGVERMIEMPMTEDQTFDVGELQAMSCKGSAYSGNAAQKSAIEEVNVITIDDDVVVHDQSAELNHFVHDF
jgi:hypothetical protein